MRRGTVFIADTTTTRLAVTSNRVAQTQRTERRSKRNGYDRVAWTGGAEPTRGLWHAIHVDWCPLVGNLAVRKCAPIRGTLARRMGTAGVTTDEFELVRSRGESNVLAEVAMGTDQHSDFTPTAGGASLFGVGEGHLSHKRVNGEWVIVQRGRPAVIVAPRPNSPAAPPALPLC